MNGITRGNHSHAIAASAIFFTVMLGTTQLQGQEARVELRTTVTGNREQPRVMHILPWRTPQTETLDYEPAAELTRGLFIEIDRVEFRRELSYRDKREPAVTTDQQ